MTRGLAALVLLAAACSETEPPPPVECPPFEPNVRDGLSLEAAREAHRWAALRRTLRYEEARSPGHVLALTRERTDGDAVCISDFYVAGRVLFEHELGFADGLGNELSETRRRNPFRRVQEGRFGGPETQTCRSCHWRGGTAGAGDFPDNALLFGDGDLTSSADARNPPSLAGAGVVEALARQMTAELAAIRAEAAERARQSGAAFDAPLVASGSDFGALRALPDGSFDASGVTGIDADLVVRPFGWKGTFGSLREIVDAALQAHMGVQSESLVREHESDTDLLGDGPVSDPDADGVESELSDGQVTAIVAFLASQATPIVRPHETVAELGPSAPGLYEPLAAIFVDEWARGRALFDELGCASCHRPMTVLRDPVLDLGGTEIDLARGAEHPRIAYDESVGGYAVFLFSDLARHDLGEENASQHVDRGVAPTAWLTRPLWGLADSAPWLHDGSAQTLDLAIGRHGGEAAPARDAFRALGRDDVSALRVFLMSLRREWRPVVL
jgi:hypothetical protein